MTAAMLTNKSVRDLSWWMPSTITSP